MVSRGFEISAGVVGRLVANDGLTSPVCSVLESCQSYDLSSTIAADVIRVSSPLKE